MNIFVLDIDPIKAARAMVNTHINKMIVESSQVLGQALQLNGYDNSEKWVNSCVKHHHKHPSVVSATNHYAIAEWLYFHGLELCSMYTEATGKTHASQVKIERAGDLIADYIPMTDATILDITTACGLFNKTSDDVIQVYRDFYVHDKITFADFGKYGNSKPDWFSPKCVRFQADIANKMRIGRNKSRKNKITVQQLEQSIKSHGFQLDTVLVDI